MKAPRGLKVGVALVLVGLIAAGCSTQARRVNCEGRLEPINRPASKNKAEPGKRSAHMDRRGPE
jgi:hypothetical protein